MLESLGVNTKSAKLKGFFKRPCKHYPLADTYVTGGACTEADAGGKEDDPTTGTSPDDTIDLTELDAQDTANAEAVLVQLMRTDPSNADEPGTRSAAAAALFTQISTLVTDFNQSVQEESKDRKYRFFVKRLMKEHHAAAR